MAVSEQCCKVGHCWCGSCGTKRACSGTAVIDGLDLRKDMGAIYSRMGVCPQHDLLWDQLTGREHLLFYGRLKNLRVCPLHLPASAPDG